MQFVENKYIRVSDISSYLICPRLSYFRHRSRQSEVSPESVKTELLKEVSVSLYAIHASPEPIKALEKAYETACEDLAIVYGMAAEEIREGTKGLPEQIIAGLNMEAARIGGERLSELLRSEASWVSIRSEKLRMSGIVDRIVSRDGGLLPAIVSPSQPPQNGIYRSDRIRLAAYGLLMEERFGREVEAGLVEYMDGWRIREAEIRRSDRREALSIRRRIEESESSMPEARRGKWCDKCTFHSSCTSRVSFLDSLFGQVTR